MHPKVTSKSNRNAIGLYLTMFKHLSTWIGTKHTSIFGANNTNFGVITSPYEENFPTQTDEKSKLELSMEDFMGHSSRPYASPQPEPKSELELMVERFSRGTNEGCSNLDFPQPEMNSKLELAMENFERAYSNMDIQPLPPPGLTLEEKAARACDATASHH
ncbi:unnamed protein product [Linum trigynum]|uniref:Uncharacterized protein n=1 Tax=Linum trigynum TaxID=586398 RepID=A0AAV2ET28_9ROSI